MEVGIVDLGGGIRESLTTNPDYADIPDDVTAIDTALQPMVTATPERNRGLGLALTRFVLAGNGGLLTVRSGRGTVYSGRAEGTHESDVSFSGTIVSLTARTDQPLDLDSAYGHIFAAGYKPEDPEDAP